MVRSWVIGLTALLLLVASVFLAHPVGAATAGSVPTGSWLIVYEGSAGSPALSTVVQSGPGATFQVGGGPFGVFAGAQPALSLPSLDLLPPASSALGVGTYVDASEPQIPGRPGIRLVGKQYCTGSGQFTIHDIAFTGAVVSRLDATFRFTCDVESQPSFGEVRYNEPLTAPLVLQAATLDFPAQYVGVANPSVPLTVTNTSPSVVTVGTPTVGGAGAADVTVTANTCPAALPSGGSCTITIKAVPGGAGARTSVLVVPTDSTAATAAISDPGIAGNAAFVLDSQLIENYHVEGPIVDPFRQVNLNQFNAAVAATYGGQSLIVTGSPWAGGKDVIEFYTGGANLVPGTYQVTSATTGPGFALFPPDDPCSGLPQIGTFTISTLTLDANGIVIGLAADAEIFCGPNPKPTFVSVRMASSSAYTAVADQPVSATLTFGNQNVNTTTASQSVVETNVGPLPISVSAALVGTEQGDFQLTSAPCPNLAPGSSCTFNVAFHPHGPGPRGANLVLTDNTALHTRYVALTGTGIGAPVFTSPTAQNPYVIPGTVFSWSPIAQAQHYLLIVGTTARTANMLNTGPLPANQTSYAIPPLPNNINLWATLFVQEAGSWYVAETVVFAVQSSVALFNPPFTQGSTAGRTPPIQWTPVPIGAPIAAFYLVVGTTNGADDVINSGVLPPTQTSYSHPPLPANRTLYAYIFTFSGGNWAWRSAIFTTGST